MNETKFCKNCGAEINYDFNFCEKCGAPCNAPVVQSEPTPVIHKKDSNPQPESNPEVLNNSKEVKQARVDLPESPSPYNPTPVSNVNGYVDKVKNSNFIKAVKEDVGSSQSLKMIKNKATEVINKNGNQNNTAASPKKQKNIKAILIAAVVVIVVAIVGLNIHVCDSCDDVFFGKGHKVGYDDNRGRICNDCYDGFWDIF